MSSHQDRPRIVGGSDVNRAPAHAALVPSLVHLAAFNAVNLVAELVGYDSREQPWWLRLLASLVALLIAIPVGEGIARGAVRLFGRGNRV